MSARLTFHRTITLQNVSRTCGLGIVISEDRGWLKRIGSRIVPLALTDRMVTSTVTSQAFSARIVELVAAH